MIYNFEFSHSRLMNTLTSDGTPYPEIIDASNDTDYFTEYIQIHGKSKLNQRDVHCSFHSTTTANLTELTFYTTIKLEKEVRDYIEIGQCSESPSIYVEFNGTMSVTFSYRNANQNIEKKSIPVGIIPTGEWITLYYSVKVDNNRTLYEIGYSGKETNQNINGELENTIVLTSLNSESCLILYAANSQISILSATYEDEYLHISKFQNKCNQLLCSALNLNYCLFAPSKNDQFFRYNVNSFNQCKCTEGDECISCMIGNYYEKYACKPCHPLCMSCSGPSNTECISCNAAIKNTVLVDKTTCNCNPKDNVIFDPEKVKCVCLPSTYYNSLKGICEYCTEKCLSCERIMDPEVGLMRLGDGSCACDSERFFEYRKSINGCACQESTYYNATLKICDSCGVLCFACNSSEGCHKCENNSYKDHGQCKCEFLFSYDRRLRKCILNGKLIGFVILVVVSIIAILVYRHFNKKGNEKKYKAMNGTGNK